MWDKRKIEMELLEDETIDHIYMTDIIDYAPPKRRTEGYPTKYDIEIRRVPRHMLGYGVLGRARINSRIVEIASDLYGYMFEKVKTHEILHILHPEKSEEEIIEMTERAMKYARWV